MDRSKATPLAPASSLPEDVLIITSSYIDISPDQDKTVLSNRDEEDVKMATEPVPARIGDGNVGEAKDFETLVARYRAAKEAAGGPSRKLVTDAGIAAVHILEADPGQGDAAPALIRELVDDLFRPGERSGLETLLLLELCDMVDSKDLRRLVVEKSYRANHGDVEEDNVELDPLDGARLENGWPVNRYGQRFNVEPENVNGLAKSESAKGAKLREKLAAKGLLPVEAIIETEVAEVTEAQQQRRES